MKDNKCPKIGEIYRMYFDGIGSVQKGWRPGLIIQNNVGNKYSPNVIALPLTSSIKNMGQPTHVWLSAKETGLKVNSIVLCENPETISKDMIECYMTKLPAKHMAEIAIALMASMPMISYLSRQEMLKTWDEMSYAGAF